MKNKLKFLMLMSLNKKIKSKWFVIANIIIFIAIAGLMNIDHIINFFGGDFNEVQKIYVIDNANAYDKFVNQFNLTLGDDKDSYEIIKYNDTKEEAKKIIEKDSKPFVIIFDNNLLDVTFISKGYVDLKNYQVIYNVINNTKVEIAIENSSITPEELNEIYSKVEVKREYIDESKSSKDEGANIMMSTIFPIIILPFFMLTIFLVQMIGAEVNDEKSTRGMEIIISNVSPKTHFFSKVLAGNLFVIIQGSLLFVYGLVGFLIRKSLGSGIVPGNMNINLEDTFGKFFTTEIIDKLMYIIPITLVLMILTFIAYSILAGVLASMTTNIEDFQQLQTPIVVISLAGYYLSIMSNMFEGALFIRVLSYFPLISAILSPSLLLLGQIGIFDMVISILIMIITNYLFIKYGLKIYKEGILNYTSKDLWKKMWKAVKK